MHDAAAAAKSPKKFHIFHERHVWKTPGVNEGCSPAEYSVIAASHPEQKPRIMRKAVRQPVHRWRSWQPDAKETATDFWIAHYAPNFIQGFQRHFEVCMQEPQNIAARGISSGVHLFRAAALPAPDNLIAEALRQPSGAVCAGAIDHDNFCPVGSLAQVREKLAYQQRFIKHRNDNRDLHWNLLA